MKAAKTAHRRREDETGAAESAFVMVTGDGHRVSDMVTGRADCGVLMTGWAWGEPTCAACLAVGKEEG
jgi:hypothetical protein